MMWTIQAKDGGTQLANLGEEYLVSEVDINSFLVSFETRQMFGQFNLANYVKEWEG